MAVARRRRHPAVVEASPRSHRGCDRRRAGEGDMALLERLDELLEHGKMHWSENEDAWAAEPRDVVAALAHEGFEEDKHEGMNSRRDRRATGGVWQGLNNQTGIVASAIWVLRSADAAPIIFIDFDGEPFGVGSGRQHWGRECEIEKGKQRCPMKS